jgi:hypothetical protein
MTAGEQHRHAHRHILDGFSDSSDSKPRRGSMQVKLDEIIRAIGNAKNELLDIEELEESDLNRIRKTYEEMPQKARKGLR